MGFDLEDFKPIFGEAKPELKHSSTSNGDGVEELNNTYIYRVFADNSRSNLVFHVTNFRTYTWEARRSLHQLDDLRDSIGLGGSWSEFINYVTSSLKAKDVKIVLDWQPKLKVESAKLVARKAKGMPLMSISLTKLGPAAADEAVANLSLQLYRAYDILQNIFEKEQESCSQITQLGFAEKEKRQAFKRKASETGNIASLNSDISSVTPALNSLDKHPTSEDQSTKVAQRVVPAYRRAKVRGVVLHDPEEDEPN
ncbi:unnamed protein product [Amaranthus hypochondriacus]